MLEIILAIIDVLLVTLVALLEGGICLLEPIIAM